MRRIRAVAVGFLIATSVFASNSFSRPHPAQTIATTARIIKINAKSKTMVVSGSAGAESLNLAAQKDSTLPRLAVQLPGITIPGGLTIPLPGSNGKPPQPKSTSTENCDEFTVVTTNDTAFQDGSDFIRFDDFKTGETISIHGVLKGTILTASRLAKWN